MHVSLQRLLPAFPLSVAGIQGRQIVKRRGYERLLTPGQEITIEPFDSIDLSLDGTPAQPSACVLLIHAAGTVALSTSLHQRICERVFLQPQNAWSAAFIAGRWKMSTAQLRRMLFSQGTALTDLCRTQRLMRALFWAMASDIALCDLARLAGWPPNGDLRSAFYDRFGLTIEAARRLANHQSPERRQSAA
ncbi:AraC family transcriptional regulator [Cupriavidus sp. H39]|uniref:AraC family transcriptional regulator n=1 Tax=Cupriavidus sp. H39 TaxID=3401635 RepID=UPI003D04160E